MKPNLAILNFWCFPCIYEEIYPGIPAPLPLQKTKNQNKTKPGEINPNVLNTDFPILSILIRNKPGKTRFNEKKERETFTSCYWSAGIHNRTCKKVCECYIQFPVLHQNTQVKNIHQDRGLTQKNNCYFKKKSPVFH